MSFLFFILLLFLLFLLSTAVVMLWYTLWGAPWVPASGSTVKKMLELAEVGPADLVYDLGSGDGRILIQAAKVFGARACGIEWSPAFYFLSKIKVKILGLADKIKIKRADFYKVNLSAATVVSCYLLPKTMEKLKTKFKKELAPGTRIVSYCFALKGWPPAKVYRPKPKALPIYLYKM